MEAARLAGGTSSGQWPFELWRHALYIGRRITGGFVVGIVLLAMVAAFLGLRLYSVLGKRTGHEQTFVAPVDSAGAGAPVAVEDGRAPVAPVSDTVFEPEAAAGVKSIISAESGFDVSRFVEGAKAAYRMILEAYWRGDEDALAPFVSDDVREAFAASIAERKAAGHVLDNRLMTIENATISDAVVENKVATITVRFDADIAAVTRDADGTVIAGSMSDAVPTHDVWTFSRTLKSDDPNWILVDTDESA
jgi:predicted lipid-binding transport protein (Tim44 family)